MILIFILTKQLYLFALKKYGKFQHVRKQIEQYNEPLCTPHPALTITNSWLILLHPDPSSFPLCIQFGRKPQKSHDFVCRIFYFKITPGYCFFKKSTCAKLNVKVLEYSGSDQGARRAKEFLNELLVHRSARFATRAMKVMKAGLTNTTLKV